MQRHELTVADGRATSRSARDESSGVRTDVALRRGLEPRDQVDLRQPRLSVREDLLMPLQVFAPRLLIPVWREQLHPLLDVLRGRVHPIDAQQLKVRFDLERNLPKAVPPIL